MQKVMENVPDERIRLYIVWLPVLMTDDRVSAERRFGEFSDKRLTCFWDGNRLTGDLWRRLLSLGTLAWDVYLLYGPNAEWRKQPPKPMFWMHQLGKDGTDKCAPLLDESVFEAEVKEALHSLASGVNDRLNSHHFSKAVLRT